MKHGEGDFITEGEQTRYQGTFVNDKREGYGYYYENFGSKSFRGCWKNDLKHGVGYVREELETLEKKGMWNQGEHISWITNSTESPPRKHKN